MAHISLHNTTEIAVYDYYPENSNSICIIARSKSPYTGERDSVQLRLFGLPRSVCDALIRAIGTEDVRAAVDESAME